MQYVGTELDVFAGAVKWKSYVCEMLRPYVGGAVLEVGAGKGSFTAAASKLAHSRWVCLEPDVNLARDILKRQSLAEIASDVEVVAGSERDLPQADVFDTILYFDVLEHIADDRGEAQQALSRLRSGGRIVILAPAFQALFSPFDAAVGHHRRYTRRSLEHIRPATTVCEAAFYLDAPGMLLSLANRAVIRSATPTANQIDFWDKVVVPVARMLDPIVGYRFGRSVVVVWSKEY